MYMIYVNVYVYASIHTLRERLNGQKGAEKARDNTYIEKQKGTGPQTNIQGETGAETETQAKTQAYKYA